MTSVAITVLLAGLLLQNIGFVAVSEFVLRRRSLSLRQIGLARPTGRQVITGLLLGLLVAWGVYWCGELEIILCRHLLPPGSFQALVRFTEQSGSEHLFLQLPSPQLRLLFALLGTLAAPVGEEVFFRGLIYTTMQQRDPRTGSALIGSALLFALLHVSPLSFVPLFLMGLALAAAYRQTGSLWVPITMHAVNNALTFFLLSRT